LFVVPPYRSERQNAEDLTQDAFLHLCRKIGTYRGESAFSTLLYRLAMNIALRRMRRKTLPQTSIDEILESHEGAINSRQELKNFDRALTAPVAWIGLERTFEQMPCDLRSALFLHVNEQHSHLEVAELTGRSVGASKSQVHRARRRLREILEYGSGKESRHRQSQGVILTRAPVH
jgi:RNA polymerase sigma-70 factor (ECF subfamily)